jgi:hypothetical protein
MNIKKNTGFDNDSGQSTIEFILSFAIAFGFLTAFYKIAMLYTNGYLSHYVTFQVSRAYMVGEDLRNNPEGSDAGSMLGARKVYNYYNLEGIIPGFTGTLTFNDPETNSGNQTNLYVGARLSYEDSLLIPGTAKRIPVSMISESFLGFEPTRAECYYRICDSLAELGASCSVHTTVTDNGC